MVGLEGLPKLPFLEMEGFAEFAKVLVLMCFLSDKLAQEPRSVKLEAAKLSENGRHIRFGNENFPCKVYQFQSSNLTVVY